MEHAPRGSLGLSSTPPWSDRDTCPQQLPAHSGGVYDEISAHRRQRVPGLIEAGCDCNVCWLQLPGVHTASDSAPFKMVSHRAAVESKRYGDLVEGLPRLIRGDQLIDLDRIQPTLNRQRNRVPVSVTRAFCSS